MNPTQRVIKLIVHLILKKTSFLFIKESMEAMTKRQARKAFDLILNSYIMTKKKNVKHHLTFFSLQCFNASKFHSLSLKNRLQKSVKNFFFNQQVFENKP